MKIILASGSPRRRELLQQAGLVFTVMSADIDESVQDAETPQAYIQRMVAQKSQAALSTLNAGQSLTDLELLTDLEQSFLLLTADTIGILPDGKTILIKPEDRAHAMAMWQQMSASTHQVCTAVQATLVTPSTAQAPDTGLTFTPVWSQSILESTAVTFVELAAEEMQRYWQTGEPADKAGGYAIQGGAAHWVASINGSYTNVVGLPLAQTLALIEQARLAV